MLEKRATAPLATFWKPVVLSWSASAPSAVLLLPVLLKSALTPVAVLKSPLTLFKSAWKPLAVLSWPVVFRLSQTAYGRVVQTGGVELERPSTDGGVVSAECDAKERTGALSRIVVRIASVRRWW